MVTNHTEIQTRCHLLTPLYAKHLCCPPLKLVMMQGDEAANAILSRPGASRRTRTWAGKHSLFRLGRDRIQARLWGTVTTPIVWALDAWDAPTWQADCRQHHALAGTTLRPPAQAT